MFYEIFETLCKQNGTSPFACCKAIGLNGSTAAYWKRAGKPPKRETLEKIADYFGVTVDYLIGRTEKSAPASSEDATKLLKEKRSETDWFRILSAMSDESLMKLHDYAELLLLSQAQDDQAEK